MGSTDLIITGKYGVLNQQKLLNATSNNINNVNTVGFIRKETQTYTSCVDWGVGATYTRRIYDQYVQRQMYSDCSDFNYFKAYGEAGLCREIHFSNCISWGVDKENHGVDFREGNERDMRYFDFLCTLIEKYLPYADLCLEVREEDYTKPEAYGHIYDMLQKRMKKA